MITRKRAAAMLGIIGVVLLFVSSPVFAGPIVFKGHLGIINTNIGGSIYSEAAIGTEFTIEFDLVTALSNISDGTTVTPFIADFENGSFFQITNNHIVDANLAALINSFAGTSLVAGDLIDSIAINGDSVPSAVGRFDTGVIYLLDHLAFDDEGQNNYPPDPADILTIVIGMDDFDAQGSLNYEAFVKVDFDSIESPLCDFKMSQATYIDGDTVTANVFRFANLSGTDIATEVKIWLGVPGFLPIPITNVGSDGSVVFPAGLDFDYGTIPLFPVTAALPRGSYELSCRILDPVTGELLWEDLNFSEVQTTYAIGDTGPAGGIVFYVTPDGLHGLEAPPVDQGIAEWGCTGALIAGADGTAIGTGAQNTADITAGCAQPDIAAALADAYTLNGFFDWFLPSTDELNELYLNRVVVGGFTDSQYWSSSEFDATTARDQNFSTGGRGLGSKFFVSRVRAIRAF